jgi:hypothetical protein
MDARKLGLVATPLVAFTILVLALRSGAREDVRAAIVYGATPSKAGLGLAWQLLTLDDDRGMKQPMALAALSVTAKANGREVTWTGASNDDGIAEVWLDLPGIKTGDALDLVVRDVKADDILARGAARWDAIPSRNRAGEGAPPWAHFGRRDGDIVLDVAVYGQRLAPSFPTPLWVRATDRAGAPLDDVGLTMETDGVRLNAPTARTDPRGWAAFVATAQMHYASIGIKAAARDGHDAPLTGEWAGTIATAPGASFAKIETRLAPGAPHALEIIGASQHLAYVEIQDSTGRVWAHTLPLVPDAGGAPRATLAMPALGEGLYWLVTSGTPSGAEKMSAATVVDPFFVAANDGEAVSFGTSKAACSGARDARVAARALGPCAALTDSPGPFARWIALEGLTAKHAHDRERRHRGILLALGALVVASVLEGLIIVTGVRDSRRKLRASGESASDEMKNSAPRVTALQLAIGLLVALLGFALIATLVLREA